MDNLLICGEREPGKIQCRLFRISTNPTEEKSDMDSLNRFLGKHEVVSLKSQYVTSKIDYWHMLVAYMPENDVAGSEDNQLSCEEIGDMAEQIACEPDLALVEKLKQWRREESLNKGWPAYRVLGNNAIVELSQKKPTIISQLRNIKGIGKFIEENFGTDIVNIITKHKQENER